MNKRIRIAIGVVVDRGRWRRRPGCGRPRDVKRQTMRRSTRTWRRSPRASGGHVIEVRGEGEPGGRGGRRARRHRSARLPGRARQGESGAGDGRSRCGGCDGERADHVDRRDEQRVDRAAAVWSRRRPAIERRAAGHRGARTPGLSTARGATARSRSQRDQDREGRRALQGAAREGRNLAAAVRCRASPPPTAARAAVDSARRRCRRRRPGSRSAQSQLMQARAGASQATAQLQTAQTGAAAGDGCSARARRRRTRRCCSSARPCSRRS